MGFYTERKSSRVSTVLSSSLLAKRVGKRTLRASNNSKKKKAVQHRQPTLEERLAEAKITEQENLKSLERLLQMGLEKKKSRVAKKTLTGPTITYTSTTMPLITKIEIEKPDPIKSEFKIKPENFLINKNTPVIFFDDFIQCVGSSDKVSDEIIPEEVLINEDPPVICSEEPDPFRSLLEMKSENIEINGDTPVIYSSVEETESVESLLEAKPENGLNEDNLGFCSDGLIPTSTVSSVSLPLEYGSEIPSISPDLKAKNMAKEEMETKPIRKTAIYEKYERSFITFSDEATFKEAFPCKKPPTVKEPKICSITGAPARYVDPKTGCPFRNLKAFKLIREAYYSSLDARIAKGRTHGFDKEELEKWIAYREQNKKIKAPTNPPSNLIDPNNIQDANNKI